MNPHKMDKWLKKIPTNRPWIEDNTSNVNNNNNNNNNMAELKLLLLLP